MAPAMRVGGFRVAASAGEGVGGGRQRYCVRDAAKTGALPAAHPQPGVSEIHVTELEPPGVPWALGSALSRSALVEWLR